MESNTAQLPENPPARPTGRIVRLEVENFKRISALDITPTGNLVVIGGDNGAGKSSVLDAVACLFGGADELPDVPVRLGEKKATIIADLGDIVVTRTITPAGGGTLKVANKEGAVFPSPQAMLDKLLGKLTFDPLAFLRMEPKPQLEALRKLVGVDFTKHDAERAQYYIERGAVNRETERLRVTAEAMPFHTDAPADEESLTALNEELEQARTTNRENEKAREKLTAFEAQVAEDGLELTGIDEEIDALEKQLKELRDHRHTFANNLQVRMGTLSIDRTVVAQLKDADTAPIRARMTAIEATNAKVRANRSRADALKAVAEKRAAANALTKKIEELDTLKEATLASTPFPVPGLGFGEAGVTFNGLPLAQASGAEKLRVSVAIGAALNPKLRVMLIRDASLLDDKSFALLGEEAKARNLQCFLEQVGDNKRVQVLIEDGHVAEARHGRPFPGDNAE